MFKRFWWMFLATAAVGAMAGFLAAAVVVYVTPKKYESEAVIEVRPRADTRSSAENESVSSPSPEKPMTPQFFGTEFEKIKSSNSLAKVVENLELVNKWGVDKETAIRILKGIVNTQNIRGTDLISINVRHTNLEDARNIVAEVARLYRAYRMEIENRDADRQLDELKQRFKEGEDRVEARRLALAEVERTMRRNIEVEGDATLLHIPESKDYSDAKRELETEEQLLQTKKLEAIGTTGCILREESVIIHEDPQIPQSPVSPNVPLVLTLGTAGGALLSPLLALPLIWLLNRRNPMRESGPPVML